jgi:hypothetical protein
VSTGKKTATGVVLPMIQQWSVALSPDGQRIASVPLVSTTGAELRGGAGFLTTK